MTRARKGANSSTTAANSTDTTAATATAEEYPLLVSSFEPEPRDFPQATCTPADSRVPIAPMESSSGLAS